MSKLYAAQADQQGDSMKQPVEAVHTRFGLFQGIRFQPGVFGETQYRPGPTSMYPLSFFGSKSGSSHGRT